MTTVELIKSIAFDFGWIVSTDEEEDTVVFDFCYMKPTGGLAMTGTESVAHLTISRTLWMRWKRRKKISRIFITH